MPPRPVFVQGCPVCGRPLEIQVEYLSRRLVCEHCGGQFFADSQPPVSLLGRAERLLDLAARRLRAGDRLATGSVG